MNQHWGWGGYIEGEAPHFRFMYKVEEERQAAAAAALSLAMSPGQVQSHTHSSLMPLSHSLPSEASTLPPPTYYQVQLSSAGFLPGHGVHRPLFPTWLISSATLMHGYQRLHFHMLFFVREQDLSST